METLIAGFDTRMALVSIFGFFVMVVLPLAFVASLSMAIVSNSKNWSLITVVTGIFFVAATALAIQFAIEKALVSHSSPSQGALISMETLQG